MTYKTLRIVGLLGVLITATAPRAAADLTATHQQDKPASSNTKKPQPRITSHDSVTVTAQSTPEEIEEGHLNDLYQPIYQLRFRKPLDCGSLIQKLETEIVPKVERARFDVPRNKFLYSATQDMAFCYMKLEKYAQAEQKYVESLKYLQIWPGYDDSAYPDCFQSIGIARTSQGHWKEAEEPLRKAVDLFREQTELAMKSDSDFMRGEHASHLRESEVKTLVYLAGAVLNQGRTEEALSLLEQGYRQAVEFHVSAEVIADIAQFGETIATTMGDSEAQAKWKKRMPPLMMR